MPSCRWGPVVDPNDDRTAHVLASARAELAHHDAEQDASGPVQVHPGMTKAPLPRGPIVVRV